ncbi:MAG TPA: sulfite oxidase [Gemmatimonadaceae bacterium]|nr:sulfite oxidase [Gemmatimonadaceae bacterium]
MSLVSITDRPLNGSPAPDALIRSPLTPADDFFVRNHGDIPATAPDVRITGLAKTPLTLDRATLSDFQRVTLEATLQCAGNRRSGLQRVRPILNELPWGSEAIGNATWEGIRLADVLQRAGVTDGAAHVCFTGADPAMGKHAGTHFGASIPLDKAMSGDVIIADTMNGAPLTPTHGAPARVIVPGYIGARSVKWLSEIRVEHEPSTNVFQAAYSVGDRVLGAFPLSCAFALPAEHATLARSASRVCGWAIAGDSHTVARVEVSVDGGSTWREATFTSPAKPFVWRLWEAPVSLEPGEHELVCRATDTAGNTQPPDADSVWNAKGYVNNSWDRVRVRVG